MTHTEDPKPTQAKLHRHLVAMQQIHAALKVSPRANVRKLLQELHTDHTLANFMVAAGILRKVNRSKWAWNTSEPTMEMVMECHRINAARRRAAAIRNPETQPDPQPDLEKLMTPQAAPQAEAQPAICPPRQLDLFAEVESLIRRVGTLEAQVREMQTVVVDIKGNLASLADGQGKMLAMQERLARKMDRITR